MADLVARLANMGLDCCAYTIESRAAGEAPDCERARAEIAKYQGLLDAAKGAIAGIETGCLSPAAATALCGEVESEYEEQPATLRGEDLPTVPHQEAP